MKDIAQSFLIPAAQGAVDALILHSAQRMSLGWGFDGNLTKLHENLTTIQPLLRGAENGSLRITKEWLMKLKSVISDAEDVMDELKYEAVRREIEVRNRMRNKVRDFFSLSNPLAFRLKMVHKVNDINLLIKEVHEQANGIDLRPADNLNDIVRSRTVIDDSKIAGRDRDVWRVKDMLLGSDTESELEYGLPVIAIVGMAGVGKTTLAQLIYNDKEVVENFGDMRIWICAPDIDQEKIVTEVQKNHNGKRYLLVLDCVLSVNADQWKDMMNALLEMGGSEGSRIMVTTCSVEVVLTMRVPPSLIYQLSPLVEDDSWTVFRRIAFADGGPRETQSLVQIGRRILQKKCKGVPFAITSLASLLYLTHDESAWMSIYNDEKLSFVPNEPGVLEQFRQTFHELPSPSLKQCFAYCAVFPKGHNIKKDELIQLWMNLGYLHPTLDRNLEMEDVERNLEMEDIGNRNCKVLMDKSLLQPVEMDEYKNITSYKIRDGVHDLAVHLYEGYRLTLEPSGRKYHTVADHLSLDFCEEKGIDIPKGNVEMLMALFPQIGVNVNRTLAFSLFGDDVEKLPNSIRKFLRLRYLDLSETSITILPKFITKLYNLQTLKLPMDLTELPKQFHKLVSLRHFCMPNASQTRKLMPMKIGQLTCLQTLPFFVVGEGSGRSIEELGSLSKLSGRLHIYSLQHIKDREEAERANMSAKPGILELGFHWYCKEEVEGDTNASNQEEVEGDTNASNQEEVEGDTNASDQEEVEGHTNASDQEEVEGHTEGDTNASNQEEVEGDTNASDQEEVGGDTNASNQEEVEGDTNASNQEEVEGDTNASKQVDVLEGLKPHMNIRGLILEKFGGQRFPSWMMSIAAPLLLNLVKIELRGCSLCEQVPSLGHLPHLEIIEMVGFDYLQCIGPKFWGDNDEGAEVFPVLRKLTLDGMPKLREWSLPAGTGGRVFFPCLKDLYISGCPLLITIPSQLFSFQELTISSQELTISSSSLSDVESGKNGHPSLTICSKILNPEHIKSFMGDLLEKSSKSVVRNLTIRGLNVLRYLPNNLRNLASLEKLEIIECDDQISDVEDPRGFNGLTSLQQLSVKRCRNLTQLPKGLGQQTLVTLEIDSCPSLGQLELGSLTSLQNLMIKGCPGLVSCWKEKLLNMTSLRKLEIGAFSKGLDYFPWPSTHAVVSAGNANVDSDFQPSTSAFIAADKLPQLRSLGLWGWEKLTRLPEVLQHLTTLTELSIHSFNSLEALPDWLANLSSLQSLELHNCKNLAVLPKETLLQLRQLTIGNCPLLGKRCGKRTGTEWAKIAHIPSVKFSFYAEELTVALPR